MVLEWIINTYYEFSHDIFLAPVSAFLHIFSFLTDQLLIPAAFQWQQDITVKRRYFEVVKNLNACQPPINMLD